MNKIKKLVNKIKDTLSIFSSGKGFSLLELLVVVLIIGILAGIALPQYQQVVDKSRYATLMDMTRAIAEANERYYMVHDQYSTDFSKLDIDIPANSFEESKAIFDWGYCQLNNQAEAGCWDMVRLKNLYTIFYSNTSYGESNRNRIICGADRAYGDDSSYAKICKNLGSFWQNGNCSYDGKPVSCALYYVRK